MAAPKEKTMKNLTGSWMLLKNKTISDSIEPVLSLQGISWFLRKAIVAASISLSVNQYSAPPKAPNTSTATFTHIDIEQVAAGLKGTIENRTVDDFYREHTDWLFGTVKGKTSWVGLEDIDDEFLKEGMLEEEEEEEGKRELNEGEAKGKGFIKSYVESQDSDWTATQIWGFRMVQGERRYCRNIVLKKGSERAAVHLVYDFVE